jgi:periplasmic divalent cation tolerance protein
MGPDAGASKGASGTGPILDRLMPGDTVHLLFTTCPDAESASAIARALVGERLAGCVTRLPAGTSTYRWQGEVTEDSEVQLLVKTTGARLHAAMERIRELHPYELPELVAVAASAGLPAYLDWVASETREES